MSRAKAEYLAASGAVVAWHGQAMQFRAQIASMPSITLELMRIQLEIAPINCIRNDIELAAMNAELASRGVRS